MASLPPPPAPTHRAANPWKLSDTARARARIEEILPELATVPDAAAEPAGEERQPRREARAGNDGRHGGLGLLPIVIFAAVALFLLRELYEARHTGEWVQLIGPLLLILYLAWGWWRQRQSRATRTEDGAPAAKDD